MKTNFKSITVLVTLLTSLFLGSCSSDDGFFVIGKKGETPGPQIDKT